MADYRNEGFTIPIQKDDETGYASIHAEMFREEDGIAPSGTYIVYMLHPSMGSTFFTLEPDNSYEGWIKEGGAFWLDQHLLQVVIDAIDARKKQNKSKTEPEGNERNTI